MMMRRHMKRHTNYQNHPARRPPTPQRIRKGKEAHEETHESPESSQTMIHGRQLRHIRREDP
ncbi:hypothetical protein RvY_03653 [Ramazzottius varieornatus]|uniref:Uncharacterized protein n=1 Tax=Ramazzottius varieornatus TaxID=947166 RepID=A0A1D1UY78_RAMVA|nr:hypothetical protein RvY_03653 [Ramazzottius varieornatus]